MKKKICMLILIFTFSAAALAGCSNAGGSTGEDNVIIDGESESKEMIQDDFTDDEENENNEDNEDVEADDIDENE